MPRGFPRFQRARVRRVWRYHDAYCRLLRFVRGGVLRGRGEEEGEGEGEGELGRDCGREGGKEGRRDGQREKERAGKRTEVDALKPQPLNPESANPSS